jgi:hypothetical protein
LFICILVGFRNNLVRVGLPFVINRRGRGGEGAGVWCPFIVIKIVRSGIRVSAVVFFSIFALFNCLLAG